MEIKNLISFLHVAELGSFTKAAHVLGYSQAAVSFQIKQLEQELDCMLFERMNHTIRLTEKGYDLLVYARQINHLTEDFKQNMKDKDDISGHIHMVIPDSICEMMMMNHYADFYAHYPHINLKFSSADTDDMFRILNHNEADIIFTLDSHVYHQDYITAKEEQISLHFVTSNKSPFAGTKNLSIYDIADQPFLLTEKGVGYRRVFENLLAEKSLEINPVLEIGRTDIISHALEQGIGIAFLPDFVTETSVQNGSLVHLDVTDFKVEIWKQLIYHRNKWMSRHFRKFIEYVMEHEFIH